MRRRRKNALAISSSDIRAGQNGALVGFRSKESGASLVEYAIILIFFLTLLFGISGFGHALFVYHHLNNAAKEATRYAAVRGATCSDDSSCMASNSASGTAGPTTAADILAYVISITPSSIDSTKLVVPTTGSKALCGVQGQAACAASSTTPAVCTTAIGGGGVPVIPATSYYPGCEVEVTVAYPYNFIFPFLPAVSTTTAPCTSPGFCLSSTSQMVIVH